MMSSSYSLSRRQVLKGAALLSGAALTNAPFLACASEVKTSRENDNAMLKGNINHSVCRWCYASIPLDELCESAKAIGIKSIELTTPEEWPTLKKYDLTCAMGTIGGNSLTDGYNEPAFHEALRARSMTLLRAAAEAGVPSIIVFSGNRRQISDEQGLDNCAAGLAPVVKAAEQLGVNVVMELLNSKYNHPDYQCDRTHWGVALAEKIGSPSFSLLYDIYHMQIMEGDVIATIRKYKDYIGHYHTGGVPGRNEINENQELYYPAIMRAIVETGYTGYVGQEFIPTYEDKIAALAEGVRICDV
jgi:hydroxypyruvate isomerase